MPVTKRTSKTLVRGVSAEKMNEALASFATADARQQHITAEMDAQISVIHNRYQAEMEAFTVRKTQAYEIVQTYCEENMEKLFAKNKSFDTEHGRVGFRTGTPRLRLLPRISWEKVLSNLKTYLPAYVRTVEEPAKDRLLTDRHNADVALNLKNIGLCIEQDERFFIELMK